MPHSVAKADVEVPVVEKSKGVTKGMDGELMEDVSTVKGKVSVSRDGIITILKEDGEVKQIAGKLDTTYTRAWGILSKCPPSKVTLVHVVCQ